MTNPATNPGFVNAQDHHAVGDGVTDDTQALQNAITAIGSRGGTLYLPYGVYRLTKPLTPRDNLSIDGDGRSATRLVQANPDADAIHNTNGAQANLAIRDLDIRGPSTGRGMGINLGSLTVGSAYLSLERVNVQGFGGGGLQLNRWQTSTLTNVRSQGHGGHPFNICHGTSWDIRACYALSSANIGFRLAGVNYCKLSALAADKCAGAYLLNHVSAVTMSACGAEAVDSTSPNYPGAAVVINGGRSVNLTTPVVCGNTATAYWVTGAAKAVTLTGPREAWPTPEAISSLTVDAGCQVSLWDPDVVTPMRLAADSVWRMGWGVEPW